MPWFIADAFAESTKLDKNDPTEYQRRIVRIVDGNGEQRDIISTDGGAWTERRISPDKQDTTFVFGGDSLLPFMRRPRYKKGDARYDKYQQSWKDRGVYDKGGVVKASKKLEDLFKK